MFVFTRNSCFSFLLISLSEFSLEKPPNQQTVSPGEENIIAVTVFAMLCFCHRYIYMQIISFWGPRCHPDPFPGGTLSHGDTASSFQMAYSHPCATRCSTRNKKVSVVKQAGKSLENSLKYVVNCAPFSDSHAHDISKFCKFLSKEI